VPLVLAGCALVFVLAQRLALTWAAPLAVVVAGIGGTLQPLHDISLGGISMASSAFGSPTRTSG